MYCGPRTTEFDQLRNAQAGRRHGAWRRALAVSVVVVVELSACRPEATGTGQCTSNEVCADRDEGAPFCVAGACVECEGDGQCACHEVCAENRCSVLGAHLAIGPGEKSSYLLNAHGRWVGSDPEAPDYRLEDVGAPLCGAEVGCGLAICNPLTGGCVANAKSCTIGEACIGANGEISTCLNVGGFDLCMPLPLCRSDNNCCADSSLACDVSVGLCRSRLDECTPPETFASTCPTEPKTGCDSRSFCSSLGECVECLCDDDCDNGFSCFLLDHTCRQQGFCLTASQCDEPSESCDLRSSECKPRCADDGGCRTDEYCALRLGNVCRPLAERSCADDEFEAGLGNNSIDTATAIIAPAPGASKIFSDLSLCSGDVDWYVISLQRGDRLVVTGQGLGGFNGRSTAYAPDRLTELDVGSVGGSNLALEFIANANGNHYVAVDIEPGEEPGFYQLTFSRSDGQACSDGFEEEHGANDLPAAATRLFVSDDVGATPNGCERAGVEPSRVSCPGLLSCASDVDYYAVEVVAGSHIRAEVTRFTGDLNLYAYGPFSPAAVPSLILTAANTIGQSAQPGGVEESLDVDIRAPGVVLLRVEHASGPSTSYDLNISVGEPKVACSEDVFDRPVVASAAEIDNLDIVDRAGFDDERTAAVEVVLQAGNPLLLVGNTERNLCPLDNDWMRLRVRPGEQLEGLPAGHRVRVKLTLPGPGAMPRLGLGPTGAELVVTEGTALWPLTDADELYLRVFPAEGAELAVVAYEVEITLLAPPDCDADDLGDPGAGDPGNAAPSMATALLAGAPLFWPDNAGEIRIVETGTAPQLSSCPGDDDWYRFVVPRDTVARIFLGYDASQTQLSLALYDNQVSAVSAPTAMQALQTGLLSLGDLPAAGYQSVRFVGQPGVDTTVFFVVHNVAGWPAVDYSLGIELHTLVCQEDTFEENDRWEDAVVLPLMSSPFSAAIDLIRLDPLPLCTVGGEEDWFKVYLAPGDRISARVDYLVGRPRVDLSLYSPGLAPQNPALAETLGGSSGVAVIEHQLAATDPSGEYSIRVRPRDIPAGYVFFSGEIERDCIDDALEPAGADEVSSIDYTAGAEALALRLCYEDDWFNLTVAQAEVLTICVRFSHASGDIDLRVYDGLGGTAAEPIPGVVLGVSLSKEDTERVVVNSGAATSYGVHVSLDPRDDVETDYRLSILAGDVSCP